MKKIVAIALVLCMAVALCACGGAKKEESNVIKIGIYEPLSGDNGAGGK